MRRKTDKTGVALKKVKVSTKVSSEDNLFFPLPEQNKKLDPKKVLIKNAHKNASPKFKEKTTINTVTKVSAEDKISKRTEFLDALRKANKLSSTAAVRTNDIVSVLVQNGCPMINLRGNRVKMSTSILAAVNSEHQRTIYTMLR